MFYAPLHVNLGFESEPNLFQSPVHGFNLEACDTEFFHFHAVYRATAQTEQKCLYYPLKHSISNPSHHVVPLYFVVTSGTVSTKTYPIQPEGKDNS